MGWPQQGPQSRYLQQADGRGATSKPTTIYIVLCILRVVSTHSLTRLDSNVVSTHSLTRLDSNVVSTHSLTRLDGDVVITHSLTRLDGDVVITNTDGAILNQHVLA
jgi:hypothetical protein